MRRIGDLGEFGLIARTRRTSAAAGPAVRLGIGDDAALLRVKRGQDLVVSTDACVEDVHFRWRSAQPRTVGRRAMLAALSDLAAMGARPLAFTWALAAPPSLPLARFDGLLAGLLAESEPQGCALVGGNMSGADRTSLTLTVLGGVPSGRALRRRARVSDRILVTGVLGASALDRLRAERSAGRVRYLPPSRLAAGRRLAGLAGVVGCIDVSDGLEADLRHLLGPDLELPMDPRQLPRPAGFERACARLGADPVDLLLRGGEDYELLFSVRKDAPNARDLSRHLRVDVTELGRVRRASGDARTGGWRHF